MNPLLQAIEALGFTEIEAMNLLTEAGIISDNCVLSGDVAVANHPDAIRYLKSLKQDDALLI